MYPQLWDSNCQQNDRPQTGQQLMTCLLGHIEQNISRWASAGVGDKPTDLLPTMATFLCLGEGI
jgi:hypothetical protein